ncbi:MAG: helix-turn-helix domain-containing protein [Anaerobutyricum hallii]|uniref:helix-turn-helix domain-containing protein n=1 Tax=Anaerobutyricum hallii TaxID=39488 RepID=UPI003996844D
MKTGLSIQEKLKDLRVERGLNLDELSKATNISKSALGSYENDDYKEINHGSIVTLAKFYGVSTDYLLGLTENRNHSNAELTELHLSDDMVELLKSGRINNRLLCEIATHPDFVNLLTDAEIYVNGVATMRLRDLNAMLEAIRLTVIRNYQPEREDVFLETLQASQIDEDDYFCHVTHKTWDAILHALRTAHANDTESAPDVSNASSVIKAAERALRTSGNYLDVFCYAICEQLGIRYDKLPEKERNDLKKVLKKSPHYKNSPLGNRGKR